MKIGNRGLGENAGEESGDVGRVGREKDDAEAAPDVNEELVGPRFGRFKGHQMTEEEAVHDPEGRGQTEVFGALATPRVETERTEPLVNGHG